LLTLQEDLQLIVTVLDAFSSLNLEEDLFDQVTLLLMIYSTLIQLEVQQRDESSLACLSCKPNSNVFSLQKVQGGESTQQNR
jgi:hypothetical protein